MIGKFRLTSTALAQAVLVFSAALAPHADASSSTPSTLKLATWNLEWLITPTAFASLEKTCAPKNARIGGHERRLPCDVTSMLERNPEDFDALARYAKQLNADVIAVQEVDGTDAARLVFHHHHFCFTGKRHVQNNGFAIRRGIPFRCGADVRALSLEDSLRRGAQVILFPGEPREITLLSVHLKSGCARRPLDDRSDACRDLTRQIPRLEQWIDAQARAGKRFAILGDFNRDLLAEERGTLRNRSPGTLTLWADIDDGDPPGADLVNAAQGERFVRCTPTERHTGYIDFIVLGRSLAQAMSPGSFERLSYTGADARHLKLSDHCPVAIRVRS